MSTGESARPGLQPYVPLHGTRDTDLRQVCASLPGERPPGTRGPPYQLATTREDIEDAGCIHRDIEHSKVFLNVCQWFEWCIKLGDFGLGIAELQRPRAHILRIILPRAAEHKKYPVWG